MTHASIVDEDRMWYKESIALVVNHWIQGGTQQLCSADLFGQLANNLVVQQEPVRFGRWLVNRTTLLATVTSVLVQLLLLDDDSIVKNEGRLMTRYQVRYLYQV